MKWIIFILLSANSLLAADPTSSVQFSKTKATLTSGKVSKKITIEIAETDDQMQQGLMHRKSLPKNQGMLFVFKDEAIRSFWMKNTIIDLSIAFLDKNKTIVDIQDMKATSVLETNPPSYLSRKPAQYALEMEKGWFEKNKILLGAKLTFTDKKATTTKVQP